MKRQPPIHEFTLPIRPRSKQRPRFDSRTLHAYMHESYADWKQRVALTFRTRYPEVPAFGGRLVGELVFEFPTEPRGDKDNLAGGLLDALIGVLWVDDAQFLDIRARWEPSWNRAIRIRIQEVPEPPPLPGPAGKGVKPPIIKRPKAA